MIPNSYVRTETIANKIFWLVLKTTVPAVLIVSMTLIVHHVYTVRKSNLNQLMAIAEVIAHNSTAAVSFQENVSTTELLQSLEGRESIMHAVIIDMDGKVFARFSRDPQADFEIPTDLSRGHAYAQQHVEVRFPIVESDLQIATLVIQADTSQLSASVKSFVVSSATVIVLVLTTGIALAFKLQRSISGPIMHLADTARKITDQGNYSLRVENQYSGEIGELCNHFNGMLSQVEKANQDLNEAHRKLLAINEDLEKRVADRTNQLASANEMLRNEIADKEKTNKELKDVQGQLIESSRQAGMAEIANGVLHNVGNVLNSVNVSATLIANKINGMKVESLRKTQQLISNHENDLAEFLSTDEQGRKVVMFLDKLTEHFESARADTISEVNSLHKNVDFIKDVIQSQQTFAGSSGVITQVNSAEIFDDALRFVGGGFSRMSIEVTKQYDANLQFDVDKSKLLQILTNFIKNAREAFSETPVNARRVTLSIQIADDNMLAFSVKDTGQGIPPENLGRIFTHGFTTKDQGHGFGLHSAAVAAKEMGGSVSVQSEGIGSGATFTVQVPLTAKPFPATVGWPSIAQSTPSSPAGLE